MTSTTQALEFETLLGSGESFTSTIYLEFTASPLEGNTGSRFLYLIDSNLNTVWIANDEIRADDFSSGFTIGGIAINNIRADDGLVGTTRVSPPFIEIEFDSALLPGTGPDGTQLQTGGYLLAITFPSGTMNSNYAIPNPFSGPFQIGWGVENTGPGVFDTNLQGADSAVDPTPGIPEPAASGLLFAAALTVCAYRKRSGTPRLDA